MAGSRPLDRAATTSADGASERPADGARREKSVFAVLVVAGALLGFLAASRPWVTAEVSGLVAGGRLAASGRQAAGIVPAVALVALAGGVAVLTTGRVGRTVAGALLVVAGAASAATSVGVLRTPAPAIASVVTAATGRAGEAGVDVALTAWPWAGVVSGVLVALAGVLAVVRARAFGGLSSRFDVPATDGHTDARTGGDTGVAAAAAAKGHTETDAAAGRGTDGHDAADADAGADPGQVWDALTRGEDPTR